MNEPKGPRDFFTIKEINLLGTESDIAIAKKIGRSRKAVETARLSRGIKSHRERQVEERWKKWDKFLGKIPDTHLAKRVKCSGFAVILRRRKLGIAPHKPRHGTK